MKLSFLCVLGLAMTVATLNAQTAAEFDRPVAWRSLVPNVVHDQKDVWLSPRKLSQRRYLWPTLAVLAASATLVALDPKDEPSFRNTTRFSAFNSAFSGNATAWGTVAAPVLLYSAGLSTGNQRMKKTALLAAQAVGDAEILTLVLKGITNRARPLSVQPGQSYSDTFFNGRGSFLNSHGGFPSGHAIAAFSVATVVARRYKNHKWVPFVSYGLAGVVAFSRVTLSEHFISDVVVGGALGYSISRFAVLHN